MPLEGEGVPLPRLVIEDVGRPDADFTPHPRLLHLVPRGWGGGETALSVAS